MIVLVGNYPHDGQQSMQRFLALLADQLIAKGERVITVNPQPFFGRLMVAGHGLGKWLGYLDKYLLFPLRLRLRLLQLSTKSAIVHVCDHSNSMYVRTARRCGFPTVITCHDLGAVRGALGEDTDCPASSTGKILQRWICRSLGYADRIICDSSATEADVLRLVRTPSGKLPATKTILLGQNNSFRPVSREALSSEFHREKHFLTEKPYLMHVGSSLPRKNRKGILETFIKIKNQWHGNLIFAGQSLTAENRELARREQLLDRIIELENVSSAQLQALYSNAFALFFPSKFEGFGWPIIEAQACGCPVLCSDAASLAEVAGESAFVTSWNAYDAFAAEILRLTHDDKRREMWINKGFQNVQRFTTVRMIQEYLDVYRQLCPAALSSPL